MEREGNGSYTDAEVSFENDPWSKAWGESFRTKKQQQRYAERARQDMKARVMQLTEKLGLKIEIVEGPSTLRGRKKKPKG